MKKFSLAPLGYFGFFLAMILIPAFHASAQDVEAGLKTIYLNSDYALTTHKSKLVGSNDTGSSLRYRLGFNVGDQKELGVVLQTESSAIKFLLNDTSTSLLFRDTRITYRLGYFYFGAVSGYAEAGAVAADGTDMFSGRGTGYGYIAGAFLPVGGRSLLQIDVASVGTSSFLNKDESVTVSLGSRLDIDISGHIPISKKFMTLDLGYRQRSLPIVYNNTSYTEAMQKTYIGFTVGNEI